MIKKILIAAILIASPIIAAESKVYYAGPVSVGKWVTDAKYPVNNMAGRPYLLEFWATWCRPCVDNLPYMESLYSKYGPKGLRILGLSIDRNYSDVAEFVKNRDIKYPIAMDAGMNARYGVSGIPAAILIDAAGVIVWGGHPAQNDLEAAIIKVLKDSPTPVLEGIDISEFEHIKQPFVEGNDFADVINQLRTYAKADGPLKDKAVKIVETVNLRVLETVKFADKLLEQGKTKSAVGVYTAVINNYGGTDGAKLAIEKMKEIEQKA